ncbi:MAG: DUF3604 domain-containing protein [Rhodospirillaceae bacterium]|nr:DUF3604 domain-containing protein [Rhodospirillaceae bacterium]
MINKSTVTIALLVAISACSQHAIQQRPHIDDQDVGIADLVTYTEEREACADRNPSRNAYFGDLHIHTSYSYDARPRGTKTTPEDAYRFAKGEPIPVPPYAEDGSPVATQKLKRPLDFAAVTDHSEFFGEMSFCFDPTSPAYQANSCQLFRQDKGGGLLPFYRLVSQTDPKRMADVCGEDGTACIDASVSLWQRTQEMAEAAYDRTSKCSFTSFVGYEHTGTPNANNYHRNVIFRNAKVPARAISYIETPTDRDLWEQLTEQCFKGIDGCDVLAIPHNSNLSSGAMFPSYISGFESTETAREMATLRNAMEPIMEVFQHKGNSECFNGFPDILGAPDELCEQEQVHTIGREAVVFGGKEIIRFCEDGEIGRSGFARRGCISKNDFFRSVLLTGLQDAKVIGVNSYKFGVIASTDTHTSAAGAADEHDYRGHLNEEATLESRLMESPASPVGLSANPGGLAGVWAVENSRDALFEALRRREVFGTTGPRIKPRLFGGWQFTAQSCDADSQAALGYALGVPMGSDMSPSVPGAKPRLFATAEKDPDGAPLQKLQVIKGWVDDRGQSHYEVFDIAGTENERGEIDLTTGAWSGTGSSSLCAVFEDPAFDPSQPAYYYMRAVEVPTLRWSWSQCIALPPEKRPRACDNDAPKTVQEMAWTSPIWYMPQSESDQ